jgi:hypothetical protein
MRCERAMRCEASGRRAHLLQLRRLGAFRHAHHLPQIDINLCWALLLHRLELLLAHAVLLHDLRRAPDIPRVQSVSSGAPYARARWLARVRACVRVPASSVPVDAN